MLPNKLYSGQNVKLIDQYAIEKLKVPSYELMNRAGLAAFQTVREYWPTAKKFAVVCGIGNNGGDGYVLARLLKQDNFEVEVYSVDPSAKVSPTSELARTDLTSLNIPVQSLPERLEHVDVIVDALLGTGLRAPLKPKWAQAIQLLNRSEKPILAIDIPSGIDGDSGAIVEQAVQAQVTISFIGLKYALMSGKPLNYVGHLVFEDLGVPDEAYQQISWDGEILEHDKLLGALTPRQPAAHKGDFGHVLVVGGGDPGWSGACMLAGSSALNAGAGLVSCVVHPNTLPFMSRAPFEMMCFAHDDQLAAPWAKASVFVLGPGLGQSDWSKNQVEKVLNTNRPCVVDADALRLLAMSPQKRDNWVLTPHPGEAAALLGWSVEAVESNRVEALKTIQAKFGGVVVLKGAGTLIQGDQGHFFLCTDGNPGMATGGMGDVLAGLIGALWAQGLSALQAAQLGVSVHARAGDLEVSMGERGMLASDLLLHIRGLLNPFEDHGHIDVSNIFNL